MNQTAFLHVDFKQPKELEFNRARLRRAFVQIGRVYMRDARRLVIKRGRSGPGENPGYQTGRLARSIGYYVPKKTTRRPGLMVKISPNQKNGQGNRRFCITAFAIQRMEWTKRISGRRSTILRLSGWPRVITLWLTLLSGGVTGRRNCCPVSCSVRYVR